MTNFKAEIDAKCERWLQKREKAWKVQPPESDKKCHQCHIPLGPNTPGPFCDVCNTMAVAAYNQPGLRAAQVVFIEECEQIRTLKG